MSNYPPGVSGRELQIAGPDWEGVLKDVQCDNEDAVLWVVEKEFAEGVMRHRADMFTPAPTTWATSLWKIEGACPFSGDVDSWVYQRVQHWTCLVCGKEHEIDLAEEDGDRAYDEWKEREL